MCMNADASKTTEPGRGSFPVARRASLARLDDGEPGVERVAGFARRASSARARVGFGSATTTADAAASPPPPSRAHPLRRASPPPRVQSHPTSPPTPRRASRERRSNRSESPSPLAPMLSPSPRAPWRPFVDANCSVETFWNAAATPSSPPAARVRPNRRRARPMTPRRARRNLPSSSPSCGSRCGPVSIARRSTRPWFASAPARVA